MAENRKALLVHISGLVQGVGFRFWTEGEARSLGLEGWVRNEPDGTVKALVAGPASAVDAMLERLRRGPSGAAVSEISTEDANPDEPGQGFRILR